MNDEANEIEEWNKIAPNTQWSGIGSEQRASLCSMSDCYADIGTLLGGAVRLKDMPKDLECALVSFLLFVVAQMFHN